MQTSKQQPPAAKLPRVIRESCPPRALIAVGVSVSLVSVAATLAFPILTRHLIDALAVRTFSMSAVLGHQAILLLLGVLVAGAVAGGVSSFLLGLAGLRMTRTLKARLFASIIRGDLRRFDAGESGELVSRLANDTQVIARLMTKELSGLCTGLLLLVGSAVALCFLDVALTVTIFGVVLVAFLAMAPIVVRMAGITRAINDSTARLSAHMTRVFGEIRLVKAFTAEAVEMREMDNRLSQVLTDTRRATGVEAVLAPLNGLALTVAMVAILFYGGTRVQTGTLSAGTLTAFILYIFNIAAPLIQLSTFASQLQASRGASDRIAEQLDGPTEVRVRPHATASPPRLPDDGPYDLAVENVVFSYVRGAPVPTLAVDRLVFKARSQTVLLGRSGCGKTTLFSLIERFYEPDAGRITYGGSDIATLPLDGWRQKIGYVPQSAPLMLGTVRDNVCYGDLGAPDDDAVIEALRAANCVDFVRALEAGLDTNVGEGGIRLSGGQRQRLAIARMFYRNPEILLLDEATSNLDPENEAAVLAAIEQLTDDRTSIMITHRVTSIEQARRVHMLGPGQRIDLTQQRRPLEARA